MLVVSFSGIRQELADYTPGPVQRDELDNTDLSGIQSAGEHIIRVYLALPSLLTTFVVHELAGGLPSRMVNLAKTIMVSRSAISMPMPLSFLWYTFLFLLPERESQYQIRWGVLYGVVNLPPGQSR